MKPALNLKQSQRLTMTPQLQQAIRLLQMNTVELSEELIQAHESNPLLEMEDPLERQEVSHDEETIEVESSDESRESLDEDWVSAQTYNRVSGPNAQLDIDFDIPDRSGPATLRQSLEDQLSLLALSPEVKLVSDRIVQYLDDAGYLQVDLEEIYNEVSSEIKNEPEIEHIQMEQCLEIVQSLEPTGVGARAPSECLLLQLRAIDNETPGHREAGEIVRNHLHLLADRDYQTLKRKLGVGESELKQAVDLIKHLNPHPGFSVGDISVNYIVPDVVVEHHRGIWLARLNTGALPRVVINQDYQQLVTENSASESFSKMKEQLQDARWLLSNIEKRHSTILSVASEIVERQQAFFDHGPAAMKPMILRDVSEALDIHESTVSRATNGKYMLTPLGVYELRYFFSTELGTGDGNQASSVAIQTLVREMIENEPTKKPISDMKICEALKDQGYEIARRTVAKYREQMNIPPSSKRKSL
ncbi:MAG: RNA polymerase factor sigma-54 [Arenicellales bacterium]